jgi:prolyl-tRNA synthetase
VVRPTSETVFGEYMAKWVQGHRDLPLLLNQWANVVRWELRPRVFLRTTEFLWQEGHTAHATAEEAHRYAVRILLDVYRSFMVDVLALPVQVGRKTARERFAGAVNTLACEAMMGDGKALQMGTSHELGQNFARAFDISFLDREGVQQHVWTTSWGVSTRMVGGLIMGHGDDAGLRVPPALAPIQVVVQVVRDDAECLERARLMAEELRLDGVRVVLDDRVEVSFGRRATDWELKGVPVRIEVGPRDLAQGVVTMVRRDLGPDDPGRKRPIGVVDMRPEIERTLVEVQRSLHDQAAARSASRLVDVAGIPEAVDAASVGWARIPWALVGDDGEDRLAEHGVTVRCLQRPDGSVPDADDEPDLVALVARAY